MGATEPLRSTVNGVGFNGVGFNGGGFNRFGFNGFGYGGFGRGCWNCGFGFGGFGFGRFGYGRFGWGFGWGGWGWGWPWLGFGLWDPWWWGGPGYGYYPYYAPDANVYGYPDSGYSAPDDNSNPPPPQDGQYNQPYSQNDQGAPNGDWVTPNGPNPSAVPNSANLAVPVLIYMKNGSVLTVRDYWMVDGDLHYILMNGVQRTTNLEQVDLPRTNTENAKSGVKFIFKSEPSAPPSTPDGSAPPAKPNSIQPNGTATPEAHT